MHWSRGTLGFFWSRKYWQQNTLDNLLIKILENVSLTIVAPDGIMDGKHIKRVINTGAKSA